MDFTAPRTRPAKGWQSTIRLVPGHVLLFQGSVVAKVQALNVDNAGAPLVPLRLFLI